MTTLKQFMTATGMLLFYLQPPLCIPTILRIKKAGGKINPLKTTLWSGGILVAFVLVGKPILDMLEVQQEAFSVAGGLVLLAISIELTFGSTIFHLDLQDPENVSITPLAFPLFAGTGTMTMLFDYHINKGYPTWILIAAMVPNLLLIYLTLCYAKEIGDFLGGSVTLFLGKIVGVLLLAMSIAGIKENFQNIATKDKTTIKPTDTADSNKAS